MKFVRLRRFEHAEMNVGVLVPGEADVAELPRLLGLEQRLHRPFIEEAVRVFHADHLVILHQIDVVGLEALERFIDLPGGGGLGAPVELGHEEDLLPVAVAQRLTHQHFALAVHVVPGIVQES